MIGIQYFEKRNGHISRPSPWRRRCRPPAHGSFRNASASITFFFCGRTPVTARNTTAARHRHPGHGLTFAAEDTSTVCCRYSRSSTDPWRRAFAVIAVSRLTTAPATCAQGSFDGVDHPASATNQDHLHHPPTADQSAGVLDRDGVSGTSGKLIRAGQRLKGCRLHMRPASLTVLTAKEVGDRQLLWPQSQVARSPTPKWR